MCYTRSFYLLALLFSMLFMVVHRGFAMQHQESWVQDLECLEQIGFNMSSQELERHFDASLQMHVGSEKVSCPPELRKALSKQYPPLSPFVQKRLNTWYGVKRALDQGDNHSLRRLKNFIDTVCPCKELAKQLGTRDLRTVLALLKLAKAEQAATNLFGIIDMLPKAMGIEKSRLEKEINEALQKPVAIAAVDPKGCTLLHHAIFAGLTPNLRDQLIQIGCDLNQSDWQKGPQGQEICLNPWQYYLMAATACQMYHHIQEPMFPATIREFNDLIKRHRAEIDLDGYFPVYGTALLFTVSRKLLGAASILLAHGASVRVQSSQGRSALQIAFDNKDSLMMQLLLRNGADPNEIVQYDDDKKCSFRSPLFCIVARFLPDVVPDFIHAGAHLDVKDERYELTPLYYAIGANRPEIVACILKHCLLQDIPNCQPKCTVLHVIACRPHISQEITKLLLDHGVDPLASDEGGNSAIHVAVQHRNIPFAQCCLLHGLTNGKIQLKSKSGERLRGIERSWVLQLSENKWPKNFGDENITLHHLNECVGQDTSVYRTAAGENNV